MMEIGPAEIFSVIWLGILTSISPCPLASNIAATSYIGKQIHSRFATVIAAVAYTLGRTLCYMVISMLIVAGINFHSGGIEFSATAYEPDSGAVFNHCRSLHSESGPDSPAEFFLKHGAASKAW